LTEGRHLLLGEPLEESTLPIPCPLFPHGEEGEGAALCDFVIGLVGLNDTYEVNRKMASKGEEALDWKQRQTLCKIALPEAWIFHASADHNIYGLMSLVQEHVATMTAASNETAAAKEVSKAQVAVNVVLYEISGADDAMKYSKWRYAKPSCRVYIPLRSPDPFFRETQELLRAMGGDMSAWPDCLLGPGLPSYSSTLVRKAFVESDEPTIRSFLHPAVAAWLKANGPWRPRAALLAGDVDLVESWVCLVCSTSNDGNDVGSSSSSSSSTNHYTSRTCRSCGAACPSSSVASLPTKK